MPLTRTQEYFLTCFSQEEQARAKQMLQDKKPFWGHVVPCAVGQLATGCYENCHDDTIAQFPDVKGAPVLFLDRESANDERQEEIDRYKDEIENGERESDDEWEGELYRVVWNKDDTLTFFDESGEHEIDTQSIETACGL